jgi:hypothetical protein
MQPPQWVRRGADAVRYGLQGLIIIIIIMSNAATAAECTKISIEGRKGLPGWSAAAAMVTCTRCSIHAKAAG